MNPRRVNPITIIRDPLDDLELSAVQHLPLPLPHLALPPLEMKTKTNVFILDPLANPQFPRIWLPPTTVMAQ